MECPTERREVSGTEESCALLVFDCGVGCGPCVQSKDRRFYRERSEGDWTEGEDRTTRGSLAVQFGSPEAAIRGGVSAASESVCASVAVM